MGVTLTEVVRVIALRAAGEYRCSPSPYCNMRSLPGSRTPASVPQRIGRVAAGPHRTLSLVGHHPVPSHSSLPHPTETRSLFSPCFFPKPLSPIPRRSAQIDPRPFSYRLRRGQSTLWCSEAGEIAPHWQVRGKSGRGPPSWPRNCCLLIRCGLRPNQPPRAVGQQARRKQTLDTGMAQGSSGAAGTVSSWVSCRPPSHRPPPGPAE